MKTNTKITLGFMGVLVAIIAVLAIVIVIKNQKTKAKTPNDDTPLTADDVFDKTSSGNANAVTDAEIDAADKLAAKLYRDMDGLNLMGHDDSLYEEMNLLSDRELSILNAVFNKKYGNGETLIEWLEGESFRWSDDLGLDTLVKSIINRLNKI
ncbi:MAG: hypothetical protein ACI30H_02565 [Paludibacteraceae bacterium]